MKYLAILVLLLCCTRLRAQSTITPRQAKDSIGRKVTVCGTVSGYHTRKLMLFLDFGGKYPNQVFSAVAVGSNIAKFPKPNSLTDKTVCITGGVKLFAGLPPEIVLTNAAQLTTQ